MNLSLLHSYRSQNPTCRLHSEPQLFVPSKDPKALNLPWYWRNGPPSMARQLHFVRSALRLTRIAHSSRHLPGFIVRFRIELLKWFAEADPILSEVFVAPTILFYAASSPVQYSTKSMAGCLETTAEPWRSAKRPEESKFEADDYIVPAWYCDSDGLWKGAYALWKKGNWYSRYMIPMPAPPCLLLVYGIYLCSAMTCLLTRLILLVLVWLFDMARWAIGEFGLGANR